ncbi:hypothetical protein GOODEAATRI_029606 [Goodea atripinnis]|uniref:Uncharacterized protein n=1 Tax=Goodea atripinnis TaxID=208336 RepID=A0ABV0PT73_9TELE
MTVAVVFMSTGNKAGFQLTASNMYRDSGPHSSDCGSIRSDLRLFVLSFQQETTDQVHLCHSSEISLTAAWKPLALISQTIITFSDHVVFIQSRSSAEVHSSHLDMCPSVISFIQMCSGTASMFVCQLMFQKQMRCSSTARVCVFKWSSS